MDVLKIKGNNSLTGEFKASGAKNAITKMLVASLISKKRCIFSNVPNITEVQVTIDLCREIGMEAQWDKETQTLEVITKELKTTYIPQRFSGANRIPILMIGALLGRTDKDIVVPTVGGCNIGKRPVTFHIDALRALGAEVEYRDRKIDGAYFAQSPNGLKGTIIELPYPSVGATENIILAASRAKGVTILKNAATEPEVIDLILFLQKLGINIYFDLNRTMITFLNKIREIRGGFQVYNTGIEFFYKEPLKGGVQIETSVHPGFMTDWQQPFVVVLTQAKGTSIVHETVYENRFGYTKILNEMGADIESFSQCLGGHSCRFAHQNYNHSVIVRGPTKLTGHKIAIPDLRAGFAYVLAALISPEESEISNLFYLDRGYESLETKLSLLGADIQRVPAKEPVTLVT